MSLLKKSVLRAQKIVWLLQNIQVFEEIVSWNLTEKEKVLRSRLKSFWQIKGLSTFLSPPHKCGFGKYLKTFLLNSNINISQPTLLWTRHFPRSNFAILSAYLKVYFKATIRFFAKEFRERKISTIWNYLWFIYQLNVGQMATRCQIHSKLSLLVGVFTLRLSDLLVLGVFRSKTRLHKKHFEIEDFLIQWNCFSFCLFSSTSYNVFRPQSSRGGQHTKSVNF